MSLQNAIVDVRHSRWFSNLTTFIIIFYSSVLGIKTIGDLEGNWALLFLAMDYFVTLYFLVEIIIKMLAEKNLKNFFKDGWNVFDFIIVTLTLVPLENSVLAPIARLLRIFRVLRLITSRPELKKIIDMVIKAIPSIVDIVVLMFIIFYIYAIVGNFLFEEAKSGLWSDFLVSMLTLFRVLTFEDWTDVMYEAMEIYSMAWLYFVSFIVIAAFVFFNLFVAVIIGEMEKMNTQEHDDEHESDTAKIDKILQELQTLNKEVATLKAKDKT